jgi:hypothetical protein
MIQVMPSPMAPPGAGLLDIWCVLLLLLQQLPLAADIDTLPLRPLLKLIDSAHDVLMLLQPLRAQLAVRMLYGVPAQQQLLLVPTPLERLQKPQQQPVALLLWLAGLLHGGRFMLPV